MKRRTKPSRTSPLPQLRASLLAATALSVLSSLAAAPTFAQSASWNGTTSSDWFNALNWSGAFPNPTVDVIVNGGTHSPKITGGGSAEGGNLRVGDAATGTLTIESGTLEVYNTAIGKDGGTGTITVDGPSAVFRSSTPISVGGENGTGTLTIRNGGSVSTLQGVIGDGLGSTGTATVDGPNSSWVTTGAGMVIGNYGEGHFTVSGGGSVNNERAMLGLAPTGRGTLVVTGAGSSWIDSGDMYVGYLGGSGTLEVRAGGAVEIFNTLYIGYGGEGIASVSGVDSILTTHGGVTVGGDRNGTFTVSDRATVNSGGGYIDAAPGYQGVATVTGAGSTWTMGDQLIIALEGRGTLTVTDGGRLETTQISLGSRNGANGTLTISDRGVVATNYVMMAEEVGANATLRLESGGRLEAQQVQRYDGAGTVVFDGGILRLTASQFGLFSGFQTGDVTLAAGGGTIDTGTFQVHMDVGLVGSGSLTKLGTGTFHLWGANSYSGTTLISAGTVRARETNVLSAASTHDIASGATLRLDNNKNQVIGGLAGAGSVLLGNAQLTIGANDSSTLFSGVISGTGKLVKSGSGTLTLSGNNEYSGGTEIVAGTLAVSADANLGGASGGLSFNGGTLATTASFDTFRSVSLLQAGTIDVAASTTLGLTGVVSGTGDLRKTGSGTLRLDNTGNGFGNTLVEAGTLIGTASSISGNISNAGTVVFDQATDATFAGTIGGLGGSSGAMVKLGAGNLTLAGTSSLDWSITAGGLTTAAGRFTGNADIGTGASLTFRQNADASYGGQLTGAGRVVKAGFATLTLMGTNSYSGGTELIGGRLSVSADTNLGVASGGLTFNGGTLLATASFDTSRSVSLQHTGVFDVAADTTLGLTGAVSGTGDLYKRGSGTLRLDNVSNSYGNTQVEAGTLIGNARSISGNINNIGTVVFDQVADEAFAGTIKGFDGASGTMIKQGAGNLTLTGTSSLNWSIAAGGLITAAERFSGNAKISTGASLTFDQSADASYGGALTGTGDFIKSGTGSLTLTGASTYTGATTIEGGALIVNGAIGSSIGGVAVKSGGTLSGMGTIAGAVTVNAGGTLSGTSGTTLRMGGLTLGSGASVNVALSGPSTTALFNVAGNLTLGGTLNVAGQGDFGAGVYRLIDYSGTLTNNGLAIGSTPTGTSAGDFFVQTALAGQVNLLNSSGQTLGFWDGSQTVANGTIDGGSGIWSATNTNWTNANGSLNAPYHPNPTYAVFQGTAGTVTVDGSGGTIGVTGLQFVTDGYLVQGGAIALQGAGGSTTVRVGDGTAAGANTSATIGSALTGTSTLVKDDRGTLILSGTNSYSGGTTLRAGRLSVSADANLGATAGGLTLDGGTLATTASFDTSRSVSLQQTGMFDVAASTVLGLTGLVSGPGYLRKTGSGTLRLDNTSNSYGDTRIEAGSLVGNARSISGNIGNAGTVVFDQADDGTFAGTISGLGDASGAMVKQGAGNLTLASTSSLDWTITTGGLTTAAERFSGNADIATGASLTFDQTTDAAYGGRLSGAGRFMKAGAGSLTLSGNNTFSGGTELLGGKLVVSADANLGAASGGLTFNGGTLATTASFDTSRGVTLQRTGTFDVAAATTLGLTGAVSGTGDLVKLGTGTLRLDNTGNSYGNTLVQAGMLIGNAGSISGNIGNAGTVVFDQAANGTFAGTISGLGDASGAMVKQGAGNLTLAGTSSLDWSITAGGLTTAAERFSGNADIGTGASLTFDQTANASYGGVLSGTGGFTKTGSGTLTLSGNSSYTGATTITGGALIVTGAIDSRSGGVAVNGGGTLSGTGTITGAVTVNAGGTLAGIAGSTLTMGGLTLGNGASVNVTLGAPSNAALFNVTGNLTLGGTLNVTSQGDFGAGVYRLIDYSGTLTNNGLAIGSTPTGTSAGDFFVQTALAGQVNLLNSSGQTLGFWDGSQTVANGTIDGGSGIWSATNTNWTNANGSLNAPYHPNPTYAVFQGTAGTVTVDGSGGTIGVTGLQFVTDGYLVQGGAIALQGAGGSTTVRVGDGTAAGASTSATVTSALTGTSTLVKDDLGTLILAGNNSYSGGTMLRAGSLSVSADANLGAASGGLIFNGGVLATTESFDTSRNISLQQAGRFDVATGTTLGLTGRVSGTGDLRKMGSGTLRLDNLGNSYGNTQVQAGTLIGNAQSISGNIGNAGTVMFDQAADGTFAGAISGLDGVSGSMVKRGAGKLTLAGTSTLDWTITAGGLITAAQRFSGNVSIGADASLTFDQSTNASYGGALSGAGGFVKTGAGSLTLTGNSTHAGATTIDGGALVVTGAIDSRSGGVAVNNSATLSGTGTIAGPVTVNAGGTLAGSSGSTLTMGGLTLSSGSSVNVALGGPSSTALFNVIGNLTLDGTLNVTDLGGFGQGIYRLFDYGGALTDNGLTIGTLPGSTVGEVQTSIAKQVNLLVSESGPTPTILFWNGTTSVPTGTVQGGSGSWGGATTNWTNASGTRAYAWNGVFAVFQGASGIATVDATGVSVTGLQFAVDGYRLTGGAVTLNGADGSTTVRVGDGTATGAGFTAVIDSSLIGDSRLVKNDLGTLVLTGGNSYSGGTTIAAGTLQIGNGGTSGSILGNVTNNGLLRFARSDATTFGGAISGSGGVQVQSGSVTFTATNSYAGPTTIGTGASLQLGTGGAAGTIVGDVANSGTLIVNLSAAFAYAGVLSGNGTVRQIGSGVTSLSGDSSSFTGTTRVENGVLSVNGKLGGTVTVMGGGQLQGSGTVSNVAVAGTIAPGNSIGTLNVGNVTFQAGSIYQVEVNASGQSDRIVATGTATLNGGSVQVLAGQGSYQANTTYTILTAAGGRTGTFAGVTSNLAFLAPSLSYDPDNVYLTLTRNTVSFPSVGGTFNQRQAGAGVESLGAGNPIWNAVVQMDAPTAQAAFNQLSGEVHASAKTALYEDSRLVRDGALSRLRQAFGGSVVAPSTAQVASVDDACSGETCQADPTIGIAAWAQGFGSWGYTSSDGNAAGLSRSTGGVLVGVDAPVFEVARLGLFGGYSHTNFNVADRQSSGGSDNVHLGAYGGAQWGPIGVRAGLAYTWHNLSTSRSVAFPGFADSLRATYGAGTFQVFGEAGYRVEVGQAAFEPFANIAYMSLSTKGFSETGGAAALTSTGLTNNVTATTLGLRAGSAFVIAGLAGQARGTVGWQHAFTDTTPWANLQLAGGTPFTAAGVPIARDAALLELGIDLRLSERASVGLGYTGQFAAGSQDQSVRGNFTFKF